MLDQSAWPRVRRLLGYLEEFKGVFSSRLQATSLRRYLQGLLGDSPRKSMQAMLTRVTDPGHYQNFQHFITHATWEWSPVWRRLLELLPAREGMLVIDDTSFRRRYEIQQKLSQTHRLQWCYEFVWESWELITNNPITQ